MSTRSYICIEREKGVYDGIYCHWDGYIEHNGVILNKFYQDREKVEKLISLGDLSSLRENIEPNQNKPHNFEDSQDNVCVFYGRDRGEKSTEARKVYLNELKSLDSWIEYIYIYGLNDKWKVLDCYEGGHFRLLNKVIKEKNID